jgi:acetyltransferase-like isoleucine patch superfamily enzyme
VGQPPKGRAAGELPLVIGAGAVIRPFTVIYAGSTIGRGLQTGQSALVREENSIGDECSVGSFCALGVGNCIGNGVRWHSYSAGELARLEEGVSIGARVTLLSDPHPPCPHSRECVGGVTIGRRAKIGAGAIVLPGVTIGPGTLVAAGALVTHDLPDGVVAAGSPARVTKRVDELVCQAGFYERPYEWEEEAGEREAGEAGIGEAGVTGRGDGDER